MHACLRRTLNAKSPVLFIRTQRLLRAGRSAALLTAKYPESVMASGPEGLHQPLVEQEMREKRSLRLEELKIHGELMATPVGDPHLKHSFQLHQGCILTAQTCFPVENIHLISRHFPKRMCPSQSLCLPWTFAEKASPPPKHQSKDSQTFLPQLLPLGTDSQADKNLVTTCKMFSLCERVPCGIRSPFGGEWSGRDEICVFKFFAVVPFFIFANIGHSV